MDTKGRRLLRCVSGVLVSTILLTGSYETTAMASSIGVIDTADGADIHTEADGSSETVGQAVSGSHVSIVESDGNWMKIQIGDLTGWVESSEIREENVSVEEAAEANEEVVEEILEDTKETEDNAERTEETAAAAETETAAEGTETAAQAEAVTQTEAAAESETAQTEAAAESEAVTETEAAAEAEAAPAETEAETTVAGTVVLETAMQAGAVQNVKTVQQDEVKKKAEAEALLRAQEEARAAAEAELAAAVKAQEEMQKAAAEAALAAQQKAAEEALAQAQAIAAAKQEAKAAAEAALAAQTAAAQQAVQAAQLQAAGITQSDLDLMAAIIYCEAGGEPYIGKVAVANVVVNRMEHPSYPNTVEGVVYAPGQFSPVRNGSLSRAIRNNRADESCYQAALEALAGSSPVGDKLYFRRVNGRSGQVIGNHVFY